MRLQHLLGCAVLLGSIAHAADPPKLPPPFHTPSAANPPKIVPQPDGVTLKVPAGFQAAEFASGFAKPRYLVEGPSGEILLSDSVKNGAVYVLTDRNNDHKIDDSEKKKLIEGLDRPFGMAFWKNYLYVAEATSIKRYIYDSKNFSVGPGEEIVPLAGEGQGHWTRTILFTPKGDKFYLGIGSRSNVDPGDPEYRAAILRYNPDGSGREVIASGVRNPSASPSSLRRANSGPPSRSATASATTSCPISSSKCSRAATTGGLTPTSAPMKSPATRASAPIWWPKPSSPTSFFSPPTSP
jgi:glucose/arabinose dehydrogenase